MEKLDFYTSHHQFYIVDKDFFNLADKNFWNEGALKERMPISKGIVGISTASYGPIKGSFQVFNTPQDVDNITKFDHIVDGCLEIKSGKIQVLDCPDLEIICERTLSNGYYCVRLYSSNLNILDEDEGGDFHRIEVWPCDKSFKRKVFKQYRTLERP